MSKATVNVESGVTPERHRPKVMLRVSDGSATVEVHLTVRHALTIARHLFGAAHTAISEAAMLAALPEASEEDAARFLGSLAMHRAAIDAREGTRED